MDDNFVICERITKMDFMSYEYKIKFSSSLNPWQGIDTANKLSVFIHQRPDLRDPKQEYWTMHSLIVN